MTIHHVAATTTKTEITKLGYDEPEVELIFNPIWEPSEEVKDMLGIGV